MADLSHLSDDQLQQIAGAQPDLSHLSDSDLAQIANPQSLGQRAIGYAKTGLKALDSVTSAPARAAIYAAETGKNPISAGWNQFGNMTDQAPSPHDIGVAAGLSTQQKPVSALAKVGGYGPQPSNADIFGNTATLLTNPLNLAGPALKAIGKGAEALDAMSDATNVGEEASSGAVKAASERLGFEPTSGMTSNSPTVQGLEDSLSQEPSVGGALVRRELKPISQGLQTAAEDLVSGAPNTSAYEAGDSALKGVLANIGEQANNVKMSYEPFNQELPKMVPDAEDKWQLADKLNDIVTAHKGRADLSRLGLSFSNGVMNSDNLADIEDLRKSMGNELTTEYGQIKPDYNVINTMTKMKDALSDFRDNQFQTLAKQAYPGPGGAAIGQQMVDQYKSAMAQHAALMNNLREVGPLFDIKATNPKDFIESLSQIPPEQMAKKLFTSGNYDSIMKMQAYFPEEFETMKGLKLDELRKASLANPIDPINSPVDPSKLVQNINKMDAKYPEATQALLGDKAQKLNDMRTVLGSFPDKIGPSGTPKGEMFRHWADLYQQAASLGKYAGYKALGSQIPSKIMNSVSGAVNGATKMAPNIPTMTGPIASMAMQAQNPQNNGGQPMAQQLPSRPMPQQMPPQQAPQQMSPAPNQAMPPQQAPTKTAATGGPTKWAADGFQGLKDHVNDMDKQWLDDNKAKLMIDPKAQNLLISASSFPPGSKPLDDIMKHLKGRLK